MRRRKLLALCVAACLAQNPASANPVGGLVVAGSATINNQGNLLTVTNTPGAVINWQGFSIAPGETTRFVQQSASSTVLNRVVGQDPSQILGALQSNGRVYLINPNGVVFGVGSRVDVNGLVASTLDITNENFTAGRRVFDTSASSTASVSNQGAITTPSGGQVYLIAPNVENSGIINSPQGEVLLAAGHHVQLVDSANPDLHVVVSAPEDHALNIGSVIAHGGQVGIYGALIDQRGVVNADSAVVGENGQIVFRASNQTMLDAGSVTSARGAGEGGTIHILGDHVGLIGDALVDASGQTGGGAVLVGGDFHGANAAIQDASATFIGADTTIRADAIESGDGGHVAVWSTGATRAYGQISAQGGRDSGNGGFAEVSGAGFLDYGARTDLRAGHGSAGTLLLDPNSVTIQNSGPTDQTVTGVTGSFTFSGGPASSILTVADLQSQLGLGNVTVTTTGGTGGSGQITVANAVGWNNSNSLTLDADNGIAINGAITAQADGRLLLTSRGGTITQTAPIGVTYLVVNSLGDVNLSSASNMVTNVAATVGDGSNLNHNFTLADSEALNVTSLNGVNGISIATSGTYSSGSPNGVISLSSTGAITQLSGSILSGKAVYASGGSVSLTEANTAGVIAGSSASGTFSYTSASGLDVGTVAGHSGIQSGDNGTFLIASAGNLTTSAPVTVGLAAAVLTASGSVSGNVTASNVVANAGSGITLTTNAGRIGASNAGSGNISFTNTGPLFIGEITQSGGGSVSITNTGATTFQSDLTVSTTTGNISITSTGPLSISGLLTSTSGGAINLTATPTGSNTDTITVTGGINTTATVGTDIATSGAIVLHAGDAINVSGPVAGNVTQLAFINAPVLPTLTQCIATPTLTGCSAVLPTLSQCTSNPVTLGCSAVLPSISQCVANPATNGCSAVLPSLALCTSTPTLAGCSVVLPTITACTATPTLAGCSAVLPTIAACAATPTLPGCSTVLPTLAACTATPTLAGCNAVLPSIDACAVTPTLAGCSAVLPTLVACIANPSQEGCGVVLPSTAHCIAAPSDVGCSTVLPSLSSCVATPTQPGCTVVLPPIATCVANPAAPGCSVVLPTLAVCVATPTLPGCGAVLPSLAVCTSAPTLVGCNVVLPSATACTATPALAGCSVVLSPSPDICAIAPNSALCQVLSPPMGSASQPVSQALNTTINVINMVAPTVSSPTISVIAPPTLAATGTSTAGTSTTSTSTASSGTSGGTSSTSGVPKDDKTIVDKTSDSAGVKNEPTPKMYCN
ncbi:MAG: filamentous hemagglutinin N-terminal domain-containing protein [Usitatibacter sp.]